MAASPSTLRARPRLCPFSDGVGRARSLAGGGAHCLGRASHILSFRGSPWHLPGGEFLPQLGAAAPSRLWGRLTLPLACPPCSEARGALAFLPQVCLSQWRFPWIETAGLDQGRAHTVVLCSVRTCPPPAGGVTCPSPVEGCGICGMHLCLQASSCRLPEPFQALPSLHDVPPPVSAGTTPRCVPCCGAPLCTCV